MMALDLRLALLLMPLPMAVPMVILMDALIAAIPSALRPSQPRNSRLEVTLARLCTQVNKRLVLLTLLLEACKTLVLVALMVSMSVSRSKSRPAIVRVVLRVTDSLSRDSMLAHTRVKAPHGRHVMCIPDISCLQKKNRKNCKFEVAFSFIMVG
jgi:hypothetical protein